MSPCFPEGPSLPGGPGTPRSPGGPGRKGTALSVTLTPLAVGVDKMNVRAEVKEAIVYSEMAQCLPQSILLPYSWDRFCACHLCSLVTEAVAIGTR